MPGRPPKRIEDTYDTVRRHRPPLTGKPDDQLMLSERTVILALMGIRGFRLLSACVAGALGLLVACGGSGSGGDSSSPDNGTGFAPSNPSAMLDTAGGQCASDADCMSGFTCQTVSLGEFQQKSCVAAGSEAGTPDGSAKGSTNLGVDGGVTSGDSGPVTDANYTCSKPIAVTIATVTPNPRPKCYLNTTVDTSSPAVLGYVCTGGNASVTFGAQTFTGTESAAGVLTVTNKSTYPITTPFLGGVTCNIDALQTITGTVASGTLQYTYVESFTPGQSSICPLAFLLCDASGPVAVQ